MSRLNKVFLFDIDGTISINNKVSNKTIKAFELIKRNNDYVFLATGRCLGQMKDILPLFNFDGFILNNGALTIYKDSIIFESPISNKIIDELLNDKLHVAFLSKDLFFRIEENEIFNDFSSGFSITPPILLNDYRNIKVYSLGVYDYNINNIDYNKYPDLKFVKASNLGFDVFNKNISKSSSINNIRKLFKNHKIIAFGDNYNDIEMLENSDFGVVMGQAPSQVKVHADISTLSVYDDGVYYMVNKIYNGDL